jgi:hypothetical protein
MKDEQADHYWICDECAIGKGWKPVSHAVTCIKRECPYCGKLATLSCSHTDWIKNGKEPVVWD